jgi:hypothetical protein
VYRKNFERGIADLSDDLEPVSAEQILPVGRPIPIGPFEEIQVLRRVRVSEKEMALISWRDTLYLAIDRDVGTRTKRV